MNLINLLSSGASLGTVTVSGGSTLDQDLGAGADSATCGFRWNTDGTVDEYTLTSGYSQTAASTDWVIPNAKSTRPFWIRATEFSYVENETNPSIFETKNGTMGSWLQINTAREWTLNLQSNTAGAGDATWVITIEIASDSAGSNILDSANYTMACTVG